MARLRTDWILFFTILSMVGFGLVMVYSASSPVAQIRYHWEPYHFVLRQAGCAVFSFLALMCFRRLDYRRLNTPACAFTALGVVLTMLVVVYVVDARTHRWFRFGGIGSLQPSEFAKPALILFLAYFVARRTHAINRRRTLAQAALAVAVLAALVVASDLGTAMIPVLTALVVFWVAGLDRRILAGALIIGVIIGAGAILAKPYRRERVAAFLSGRSQAAYQPLQSKIAVGTGGVLGAGLMQGKQKLLFLPEAHTDFIYATVGEELGLWGCTAVLAGYLIILWRGARLFLLARDDFGRYLALGITVSIVVQALFNISVALDMAPTKGFPLPLISFGGSSLVSTLASLGMLLSVGEHEG
jgi:cell division protein FtsW